jgi:hypothetical protein
MRVSFTAGASCTFGERGGYSSFALQLGSNRNTLGKNVNKTPERVSTSPLATLYGDSCRDSEKVDVFRTLGGAYTREESPATRPRSSELPHRILSSQTSRADQKWPQELNFKLSRPQNLIFCALFYDPVGRGEKCKVSLSSTIKHRAIKKYEGGETEPRSSSPIGR